MAANLKQAEDRLEELNGRLENRHRELEKERNCTIGDIQRHAVAWVLPHPERTAPGVAAMVRDEEIECKAVDAVIAYERSPGREVESVEKDNRGFDLISRRPHSEDPKTAIEVRFIEVKGRSDRRRGGTHKQRVQDGPATEERLLALRRFQLRNQTRNQDRSQSGADGLASDREDRTLPGQAAGHSGCGEDSGTIENK